MRALLLVLDGVGCGAAPDAAAYGDAGADTLGTLRRAGARTPVLDALGLHALLGGPPPAAPRSAWGRLRETAAGKDSTTGHWELAGVALDRPFATYRRFPDELVGAIEAEAGVRFLGNRAASGTAILDELGPEHLRTGHPILYTSADSVLQVAAHEAVVPPARLEAICRIARRHADAWAVGRVISRPFEGEPGAFRRTPRRHDHAMAPPPTVLDALAAAGVPVVAVGKVADLFAGRGFAASHPTADNAAGMATISAIWPRLGHGLVFANLVEFDTLFGHRRDVPGFVAALEAADAWLGRFLADVRTDDLVMVTADHGCDPGFPGTDHTREEVPLLVPAGARPGPLGTRQGFADVAATLADRFGLPPWPTGRALPA